MTEDQLEQETLGWLSELGYAVHSGYDIAHDGPNPQRASYREVVLTGRLREAIARLNPQVPTVAREGALHRVLDLGIPSLLSANRAFRKLLVGGVPVHYQKDGETVGDFVRLVDFAHPERNEFWAVNQFTLKGPHHTRRPDIILFVNGLPLVLIELKNPADEAADIWKAYDQLQTYKAQIPDVFQYNEVLVISDGTDARLGSLSGNAERFMQWRTIDGVNLDPLGEFNELETLVRGALAPAYLLDYLRYFVLFEDDGQLVKKIAGYHQYHAVRAAIEHVVAASRPDSAANLRGKGGVVWHTQGSGKSITMTCFAARVMQEPAMQNPTLVVITDRNDLDGQLFGVFSLAQDLLRETPVQASTRQELRQLLSHRPSGGIVFATIQKFMPGEDEDLFPVLSERRNIVVVADEAHRTQYGFQAKLRTRKIPAASFGALTSSDGSVVTQAATAEFTPPDYQTSHQTRYQAGYAQHLRDALPNATFVAFTGTPVSSTDRDTRAVFGDYIHVYDMQQAREDGATVAIYYESRLAKLKLKQGHSVRDGKKRFADAALAMSKAFSLCCTLDEAKALRDEVAFLQAVKVILTKRDLSRQKKTDEQRDLAIRQIINQAVVSESVVDIFDAVGLEKPNIGLLDEEFLAQVQNLPEKNLAVELLERLLEGEIKSKFATNVVQQKKFSDLLANVITRYQNRSIETAQVMEELVEMARKFKAAASRGEQLGLSEDEVKFYDALANNESAVRELTDETLKKIAHELTENLKKNISVDWAQRESVRATLRLMVKRVLRKYKYPPDQAEEAVELVLQQVETLGEAWV